MRVPNWSVLALLLAGVCVVGGLAYASFPGAEEAKGNPASSSRGAQPIGAARGYARVSFIGSLTAKSSNVAGVRKAVYPNTKPIQKVVLGAYCFNLAFRPLVVIGSPVADGSPGGSAPLSISTAPNPRGTLGLDNNQDEFECPVGFRDAGVVVRSGLHPSMSEGGLFVLFF